MALMYYLCFGFWFLFCVVVAYLNAREQHKVAFPNDRGDENFALASMFLEP